MCVVKINIVDGDVWLVGWGLTADSAQKGHIGP